MGTHRKFSYEPMFIWKYKKCHIQGNCRTPVMAIKLTSEISHTEFCVETDLRRNWMILR